jgi:uncharacterized protein (TIGR00255 family)
MVLSMTGYGQAVHRVNKIEISVEIRSYNNRFLDVMFKLPRCLSNYEGRVREMVGQYINRGRVNLWLSITSGGDQYQNLTVNKELIDFYVRLIGDLRVKLNSDAPIDISHFLTLPDIIVSDNKDEADESTWQCAEVAIAKALGEMRAMRQQEGEALEKDFIKRIDILQDYVRNIEKTAADRPKEQLDKLRERVTALIPEQNVDVGRLENELAVLADRMDVTEECVRFYSHNNLFREMLKSNESQGRKLNFLLQEMNREANTIGAKAYSAEISHLVVQIKEEVEKIREQVQNVE